jgi:lysophospholipase L1-like esterase
MKGLVGTLFVSALLLFGAFTASAAADKPPITSLAPLQLALGDSWAVGSGAAEDSEGGYVSQLHEALQEDFKCLTGPDEGLRPGACPHLELLNIAHGGDTTPDLIATQIPDAEALLQSRNGNLDSRDDVELVTLHIGGNDVNGPILDACVFPPLGDCPGTIQTELADYQEDLDPALSRLRAAAGPDTRIVMGTYDNPFRDQSPLTCRLAGNPFVVALGDLVLEGGAGLQGLHDIMRSVAARYGIEVAEVFGDLNRQNDWSDCLHPTAGGYGKVTDAFLEVLGLPQSG